MADPTSPEPVLEELREDYLFVNDPFHSREIGFPLVGFVVAWAVLDAFTAGPGESAPWIPAVALLFFGICSAGARWFARRDDAPGFRRNLRMCHRLYPWVLRIASWACVAFVISYGMLLWVRWDRWTEVMAKMETRPDELGGWGGLLVEGDDLSYLVLVLFIGWFVRWVGPRYLLIARKHAYRVDTTPPPIGAGTP